MSAIVVDSGRHSRRFRWLIILVVILVVCLTALGVIAATSVKTAPAVGGSVVINMSSPSTFINPLMASTDTDQAVSFMIFPGLLTYSPSGKLIPDLASSWSISKDGKIVSFQLKQGASFPNGLALTSADVAYTYRLLASSTFPTHDSVWDGVSISTPTPFSVVVHLPRPDFTFPEEATVGIVPTNFGGSHTPIGSGAYRFRTATSRQIVLSRAGSTGSAPPFVTRLIFQAHSVSTDTNPTIFCHQAWAIPSSGSMVVPTTRALGLIFNLNAIPQTAVRRALLAAIGQSSSSALSGVSSPMPAWPPRAVPAILKSKTPPVSFLRSSGWKRRGGTWTKGKEAIHLTLVVGNNTAEANIAAAVAKVWLAAGFEVTVRRLAFPVLIRQVLYPGKFNAAIVEWNFGGPDYDPATLWSRGAGLDFAHISDPTVMQLASEVANTSSVNARNSLRARIGQRLLVRAIAVGLAIDEYVCTLPPKLHGFQIPKLVVNAGGLLYSFNQWYLDTKLILRNPLAHGL